jgi:hypothetical protein
MAAPSATRIFPPWSTNGFRSDQERTAIMIKPAILNRVSKLGLVSLCAIALGGCAQFANSFGQLWGPDSLSETAYSSGSSDSTRSNSGFDHGSIKDGGDAPSPNAARSFTIGGVRVELADGKTLN